MTRKIGAHVSTNGGLVRGVEKAVGIGANCLQLFSSSPRMWSRRPLDVAAVTNARQQISDLEMMPVITHAMYLVNLATPKPDSLKKSIDVLQYDLQFDAAIQGGGVVVHLGSHLGLGWEHVKEQVATTITTILSNTPENSQFLIENSAGQNGKLSSDLSEIRWLLDEVKSPRLGWCLDTCHAFAAGYSFGNLELLGETGKLETKGELVSTISQLKLWDSLRCVHVNDSKDLFGSGRDRHENLEEGNIPQQWLQTFLDTPELKDVPLILEVPGADKEGPDAVNIEKLKKIINF